MAQSFFSRLRLLCFAVVLCVPGFLVVPSAQAAPIEIRMWHFFDLDQLKTFGALIKEFNATHPGIRVVPEYEGSYDVLVRKLVASIVAGTPPEITTVGCPEIPRLADTGWIDPIVLSPADKADIYKSIQKAYTYKGKMWAISLEGAAYGLYWNKKLFREAGLPMRAPRTWPELIKFGQKLTRDLNGDGKPDQWGFMRYDSDVIGASTIFNLYLSNGAQLLNPAGTKVEFDTPAVVQVLQLWKDLADKYHICQAAMPAKAIQRNLVGMWIGGSWSFADLSKTLDIGVGPLPPLKKKAILAGPDAFVVTRSSPKKLAAAHEFVHWITEPKQFVRICIQLGYLPIRASILKLPEYQKYLAEHPEKAALAAAMPYLETKPLHPAWNEMQEAMNKAREEVEHGANPAKAAAEAQREAQRVLNRYNAEQHVRENPTARRWFNIAVLVALVLGLALLGRRLRKEYRGMRSLNQKVNWIGYWLSLPQLLLFVVFDVFPIGFALYMSFFQWNMLTRPLFTDGINYLRVFSDPQFIASMERTLVWVVATVPVDTALALGVALLLNSRVKGIGFFRLLFYSPSVTSGVALAIVWWWILNGKSGLLNYGLALAGVQKVLSYFGVGTIDWLNDRRFALFALIIMDWWRSLAAFLIFLAGLQGIPDMTYEAAEIDGANRWAKFRYITWPLLMPATFFVVVTTVIAAFQVFEQIYVMTQGDGGPGGATTTLNFYLYKNAFVYFRMGYASAVAYVLGAVVLVVTLVQRRYLGREVEY